LTCVAAALAPGWLMSVAGCQQRNDEFRPATDVPFELSEWKYRGRPGSRVQSPHYDIYTTLRDERLIAALPQMMETAYTYYHRLVPAAREPGERMPVYIFATRTDWEHFTRRFGDVRAQTLLQVRFGGYTENGVVVIEYVAHQTTFPILGHEGLHQYLHYCVDEQVPAWLNEGLAVLCEGQIWGEMGLKEFDPWHNPQRRNALADILLAGHTLPLEELLRMNAAHVVGGSTRTIGAYYGQVWALVLFLRDGAGGKYAAGFQRMLEELGSGRLERFARAASIGSPERPFNFGEALFRAFISEDLKTVEHEYDEFMRLRLLGGV
jgi:hypothetical protein